MSTELKISTVLRSDAGKTESKLMTLLQADISLTGSVINDKIKERFYNDLYVLLSAGIDIRAALDLFCSELEKKQQDKFFREILDRIIKGQSMSTAMEDMKKFSRYECVSIRIGEETGQIQEILKELTSYFAKRIKMKRQMVSVFTYPVFLLTVTFGVLYFMLNNVVPMFAEVFQRFGKELPAFTMSIIHASEWVSSYGWIILLMIASLVSLAYLQKKKLWFRKSSAFILLKIPVFGKLIHKVYLARFCQSMQLMVKAKIPLVESLSLIEKMIEFYPLEVALTSIQNGLVKGSSMHEEMAKHPLFEKRMVSLIKVSEEVNSLDTMFEKLAKQYNDEVEYRTSIMGSLIEPLMILLIGVIVGTILIAMYQPLFNISNILE